MVKRISEVLVTDIEDGVSVEEVAGKEIIIDGFRYFETQHGEAMIVQCRLCYGDESYSDPMNVVTHSEVLLAQSKKLSEHLPVVGRIEQKKRYYTFA